MSEHRRRPSSSFGDREPNAQPPTPQQTPTSATFASPVFQTPKPHQGSFADLGGLTPRFAEDYSVFNSTPGNLRGTQGPFTDFLPPTPSSSSSGHKRLLSAEGIALEIAAHANHFSPNPNAPLPPVDPSRRLPSSPSIGSTEKGTPAAAAAAAPESSPIVTRGRLSKKSRRGTITKEPEPVQVLSPPPTARKGEQKLAPKPNMQHDQSFHQPDFQDGSQTHDVSAMMMSHGDLFSYPMSAPAGGQPSFWDPQSSMTMDLDFNAGTQSMFQSPTQGHRQTGSFDWNNDIHLFQENNIPPPSSNQENIQPMLQQGHYATATSGPNTASGMATATLPGAYPTSMGNQFMVNPGDLVDPGLLLGQPQDGNMGTDFGQMDASVPQSAPPKQSSKGAGRKNGNRKNGKLPERTLASSPLKPRPGLGRSMSDNRGKKTLIRSNTLPTLAPAARTMTQVAGGSAMESGRALGRSGGRVSPIKSQRRLSGLASIPETSPQSRRASVRFTIDSRGRARAEPTMLMDDASFGRGLPRSQSSRDLPSRFSSASVSEDESDGEDPIIIPSRNNSFSASFALPDPRKPVGSIFHPSRRSISDRSTSASATGDGGQGNDGESEAETVLNEQSHGKGGDAASELRKVVEGRQKRWSQGSLQPGRLVTNLGNFRGDTISPTSLAESGYGTDGQGIRCVCNRNDSDRNEFMVMW
ncbi:hypothetical protein K4F52_002960 [Lecanicillium sp. MT-2017a]|nr:hypothetical protein K4F52_002960 [Lecanicillium sp. MT-2017a]